MKEKEIEKLKMYIKYVEEYPDDHEVSGNYPVCYNEWLDNEYEEEAERFCVKCGKTSGLIDEEDICFSCAKERGRI